MARLMAVLVLVLVAGPAISWGQDLELLSISTREQGLTKLVVFFGRVRNAGIQVYEQPQIAVTLKRGGRVVGIVQGMVMPDDPNTPTTLKSGAEGSFETGDLFTRADFDDFEAQLSGIPRGIDQARITGGLRIIDETLSLVEINTNTYMLGEFVNETNAVLSAVDFKIRFFDSTGKEVGSGRLDSADLLPSEIQPGQRVPFRAYTVGAGRADHWEVAWTFIGVRLEDTPTAIEAATWGAVKAGVGLRSEKP